MQITSYPFLYQVQNNNNFAFTLKTYMQTFFHAKNEIGLIVTGLVKGFIVQKEMALFYLTYRINHCKQLQCRHCAAIGPGQGAVPGRVCTSRDGINYIAIVFNCNGILFFDVFAMQLYLSDWNSNVFAILKYYWHLTNTLQILYIGKNISCW